jgi:type IV pilus assembly protein PilY1
MPWTSRKIATFNGTNGIPFTWASLGPTLQNRLNTPTSPPGPSDGASVLAYLRGDRSKENSDYRQRTHILGDIINAEAVYVPPPRSNYADPGYAAFKTAQASRPKMLYQGANDGMLHAFDADTGAEVWAYVPGVLLNTPLSATYTNTSSLVNLSLRTGFAHRYYVDATPAVSDVDLYNTSGNLPLPATPPTDWHTILVGGLGKGGRGYFALDITNPGASSDADVAAKVLWEFPNASTPTCSNVNTQDGCRQNIGYSFGTPVIVKTQAKGWVVLVTSGYNNGTDTGGDGKGHLFVLDAKTGALIKDIRTGAGTATSPSGLAYISAYAQNADVDATTDYVYGGDLEGNVWRFDLTGSVGSWNVKKIATLVEAAGNPQPITTPPELAELATLGKRVIYVGTGQYLGESDIPGASGANSHATQTQSLYALLDDLSAHPLINPLRSNLVQQTISVSGSTATVTASNVNWNAKKGWFVDFPNTSATTPSTVGQRVIGAPFLALGKLVVTTNVPNTDPCEPGGSSWIYFFDYAFSSSVYGSTLTASGQFLGHSLASRPTLVMLPNGQPKWLTQQSDQTQLGGSLPYGGPAGAKRRIMWREVVDQ